LFKRTGNFIDSSFRKKYSKVYYIIEDAEWVIKRIGLEITLNLKDKLASQICVKQDGLRNQIIHFGSRNTYLPNQYPLVHPSNKIVLTWFHGTNDEVQMIEALQKSVEQVSLVHTACTLTAEKLINWGVPQDKIIKIPLGVDLNIFKPYTWSLKQSIRQRLGIPEEAFCIGSFQKDGNGWDDCLEPKLIKGPDIFVKVVGRLAEKYPVFVLLTGPARGFVKKSLEDLNIPYRHIYLENYEEIAHYYNAIDLYLVASREEGGPMALLESMASGVPLVSTRVGMGPDLIDYGQNAFITDVNDIDSLVNCAAILVESTEIRQKFIREGLKTAEKYDWSRITSMYYRNLYEPLLK
jgi:glycosyltransferase involved in cell wall biosynthesis